MNYMYLILIYIILVLCNFSWYYFTLEGSILSPYKEHKKPKIIPSLVSYLIFYIPIIIIFYIINKEKLIHINNMLKILCKK